jgi:hypothetical protein
MALRLPTSKPSVSSAGNEFVSSLGHLASAAGRWLALQPIANEVPVYAARVGRSSADTLGAAGSWAGATASRARQRSADAASAARTRMVNLAIVVALLWWLDRMLTRDDAG